MIGKTLFSTAFFVTNRKSVNVKGSNPTDSYFRCICVFFASISRFYPDSKKILFINTKLPNVFSNVLEKYNVETIIIPKADLRFVYSRNLSNRFPGCLFSLDVLAYIGKNEGSYSSYETIILMDNDIIFANSIDNALLLSKNKIIAYPVFYEFQKVVNGKSRATLSYVNTIMGNVNPVNWYGGEIIGMNSRLCSLFTKLSDEIFDLFERQSSLFGVELTEEHIYSAVLTILQEDIAFTPDLIKRIWTSYGYNNVSTDDKKINVLHYPSEKNRLFKVLFSKIEHDPFFLSKLSKLDYEKLIFSPVHVFANPKLRMRILMHLSKIKHKIS
jgi:hypothetical protein